MRQMTGLLKAAMAFGAALALTACDSDSGGTADTAGGGTDGTDEVAFEGGNFQLTTHEAQDNCLDGSLETLFMPNGTDTPYDLANLTEFPAESALPATYTITLQEPFDAMEVTVEDDGVNKMKVENSVQTAVKVDEDQWPNCTADMTIDAAITIVGQDNLDLTSTIEVTNWQGDDCPQATDGCTVILTMKGARAN